MFGKTFFLAAAFVAVASAAQCPGDELGKLAGLATNPSLASCTVDSGFTLVPPSGLPSDAQLTKMCKSDNCKNVIAAVRALNPTDCDLNILGVTLNVGKLVSTFEPECKRLTGGPATSAPTPAPGPGPTTAPSTPTVTQSPGQNPAPAPAPAPVDNSC